ncbi:MAG TPA: exonuclease domain-containing protein, partial [Candidatus Eisenbacteria bacterium]|nr:exonuclease domain-containing protein [Candidatus Eisenbacteria bacterium]
MLPTNFVFLDTETTGLNPRRDRIIEIGLIRVENNKEVGRFQTLLNPHTYVSPFITDITGIVGQNLENAPEFEDIAKELHEYLENAILVAHNARFDYGFLKYEFLRIGQKYTSKSLCTAKLSRILFPKYRRHNLDSIIERFNISVANRHRAFDDAMAIWEFYTKLQRDSNEKKLHDAVQFLLKHPSLPMHLRSKEIDTVSNGPGVYLFYGDNDTPLYIGKSVTVKDRIKSHFGSDHSNSREMSLSSQVKRIEVLPTSGELGALLKEAELIKKLQPVYNRKLRQARRLIIIKEI